MKRILSAGLGLLLVALTAQGQTPDIQKNVEVQLQTLRHQKAAIAYLLKLQQKDGGFAPDASEAKSSVRATNAAVRALKYMGADVPNKPEAADFVKSCFDKDSGGFADEPGGKVTVNSTTVGVLAAVELGVPRDLYETGAAKYLGDNVKTFEDIRIAAAAFEALGKPPAQADSWLQQIAKLRNENGAYGKGEGTARETGSAVAAVLRLGGKVEHPEEAIKAMQDGQRADGGFGPADSPASDLPNVLSRHALPAHAEGAACGRRPTAGVHRLLPQRRRRLRRRQGQTVQRVGRLLRRHDHPLARSEVSAWPPRRTSASAATSATAALDLDRALAELRGRPGVEVVHASSIYETAPVGGPPGQGPYLNAVAELRTDLAPADLLRTLHEIESGLGRVRAEKDGPRTIDLDLLFYADVASDDPRLTLPHPRLHRRLFVLQPLAEIAPGLVHSVLKRTIADLLSDLIGVRPAGPSPGRELAGQRRARHRLDRRHRAGDRRGAGGGRLRRDRPRPAVA